MLAWGHPSCCQTDSLIATLQVLQCRVSLLPITRKLDPRIQVYGRVLENVFRDISTDAFHDRLAVRGETVPEHIVDRYPVKIFQTRVQGVWDNPVGPKELHKRLEF